MPLSGVLPALCNQNAGIRHNYTALSVWSDLVIFPDTSETSFIASNSGGRISYKLADFWKIWRSLPMVEIAWHSMLLVTLH